MKKSIFYFFCLFIVISAESFRTPEEVKYLPLGDSYTICTGASDKQSWPLLLTQHLNEANIKTVLLDNPARNGYSTQNLIDKELPIFKKTKPDFVTLLIGVNDWVRKVPTTTFKKNFIYILDEVQKQLSDKNKIVVITIPDFGVTPVGKGYGGGRDINKGITEFNDIILDEAKKGN